MKEVNMNEQNNGYWLNAIVDDDEVPAWKRLDNVTRKWAALTGMENDLSDYQKRKELYQ
jgi:hypothetical protein